MTTKQNSTARDLADRGVRLFPQDRNKRPTIQGWPKNATTDPEQLSAWARDFPSANWAAATGAESGILVLDVDVKNEQPGAASYKQLVEKYGELATYRVDTPSGGFHLYLRYPEGERIRNCELVDYPGVELKGDGGCVTTADSFYASGAEYRISHDGEFAPAPTWLVELAKQAKAPKGDTTQVISPDKSGKIPAGQRNNTLASLAGTLRRRGCSSQTILVTLREENATRCDPPLPETEVKDIADSVAQYDIGPQLFTRTDTGNSDRLVYQHGEDIRFCFDLNKWLAWDGLQWRVDRQRLVQLRAEDTIRGMYEAALGIEDRTEAKQQSAWALSSLARNRIEAMTYLAQAHVPIAVADLDPDPWLLGAANGYIDLDTGGRIEPDRRRHVTKTVAVDYDPVATAPRWLQFLEEVFAGNAELIEFVQRAVGYSLTGDTREQCFFLLHGSGRNGKSTFIETVLHLLGPYAMATQPDTVMMTRRDSGAATPELAALPGVRFLSTVETQENRQLNESLVKQLVGGDRITARKLYADFFEFYPAFKLWLASNHLPEIKDTSHAMWRRIRLIPFSRQFTDADDDKDLKKKLLAELPGILSWAVRGCLAWQRDGLPAPADVTQATVAYQHAMDPIADFLDECTDRAEGFPTTKAQMYRIYENWCKRNGEKPLNSRRLGADLIARGWKERRLHGGIRAWSDIAIKEGLEIDYDNDR